MEASARTSEVLAALSLLTPWDVEGVGKVRIGGPADGGYVMLDRLRPGQAVFSYGVGPDSSFDADLGRRGHRVFLFDHTVERPAGDLPAGCLFTREGVAPEPRPEERLETIANHLDRHGCLGRRDLILKLDIELAEWLVLACMPDEVLACFEQIVVEFHGLNALGHDGLRQLVVAALRRLNARFTLCHVHGNVHGRIALAEGVPVVPVLEATYVRTELVTRRASRTLYPTPLDATNKPGTKDVALCLFPFLPTDLPPEAMAALARRLDGPDSG